MDWSSIIVAALAMIGTLIGSALAQNKTISLVSYRIEQLEKKVEKHNSVVERTYRLEEELAVHDEKINVANHRITDLEHKKGEG